MNAQLSRRLGRIWLEVERRLSMEEVDDFRNVAIQAKSFDDLPQAYKKLVLEIEISSRANAIV